MSDLRIGHWTKLGSAVRDARTRRQWSQHELASRAGVSRSWLAKLEAGHRGAELEQILRLLAALDMSLAIKDDANPNQAETPKAASRLAPDSAERASQWAAKTLLAAHESAAAGRRNNWALAAATQDRPAQRDLAESGTEGRS